MRAEVVVDELGLEARLGPDAAGGDGGVALLEQQLLGGIQQLGASLGVHGTDARGGEAVVTPTPCHTGEPDAKQLPTLLCRCTISS